MSTPGDTLGRFPLRVVAGVGISLAAAAAFTWPAVLNGYPLLSNDAAVFINNAGQGRFHAGRAVGYPLFLKLVSRSTSLWPAVAVQALLMAALLGRVAWLFARAGRLLALACAFGVLLLLTGAAKYPSWIMADVFTSWLFLAPALWMLSARPADRMAAGLALILAVVVHNSHLPVALAGVSLTLAVLLAGRWTGVEGAREGVRPAAWLCLVALGAIPVGFALNAVFAERTAVVNGTPALLMHRFVDSGVAARTLDRFCPERSWTLCDHREAIRTAGRTQKDWFLFDPESPFHRLGGWEDPELADVVRHALRCCFDRIALSTLANAAEQFVTVDSRDALAQWQSGAALRAVRGFMPRDYPTARTSVQVSGRPVRVRILPVPETALHVAFTGVALALAAAALGRGDMRSAAILLGVLGFLALNALVVAFGSTVHGRYQGRVAWLLPFAVTLVASQGGWRLVRSRLGDPLEVARRSRPSARSSRSSPPRSSRTERAAGSHRGCPSSGIA